MPREAIAFIFTCLRLLLQNNLAEFFQNKFTFGLSPGVENFS